MFLDNFYNLANKGDTIYFAGIGGISMSALAKFMLNNGYKVCGGDLKKSLLTEELENLGAKIYYKFNKKHLQGVKLFVYSSAIQKTDKQLKLAKKLNIKIIKRSELLNLIVQNYTTSIAVAGTHGKTTTSSMITSILECANKNPTAFIGGESIDYSNLKIGKTNYCVLEACEYQKNFLDIKPTISVLTNIGADHLECFSDLTTEVKTFSEFLGEKLNIINVDDENSSSLINLFSITYGIKNKAHYMATKVSVKNNKASFILEANGVSKGRISLRVGGLYNVYNALASAAICSHLKISFSAIRRGLERFENVKRRNEKIGNIGEANFICDYAHHPTEIENVLSLYDNKSTLVVFQPHTYSRTKNLMKEFAAAFRNVENLIIYKTYPAREKFDKKSSAKALYNNIKAESQKNILYAGNLKILYKTIKKVGKNYKNVLFLGAGDIYGLAIDYIKNNKF